jgi:hypothetical protein
MSSVGNSLVARNVPASTIAPLIAAEFDASESAARLLKAPFSAILVGIRV